MFRFGSFSPLSTAGRVKELINLVWGKCQRQEIYGRKEMRLATWSQKAIASKASEGEEGLHLSSVWPRWERCFRHPTLGLAQRKPAEL